MNQKVNAMTWILRVFGELIIYAKVVQYHRTFYFKPTNSISKSRGQCLRYLNGRNMMVEVCYQPIWELRASAFNCEMLLPSGETIVVKS
jgi:hypothetical protein